MSIAQLDTLYAAAVAAIDAEDYALAIRKLMAIQTRLATTPNLTRSHGSAGGSQGMTFNSTSIDALIAQCRRSLAEATASAAGGMTIAQIPVTYERPTT